jgi:hypothetical protein
MLLLLLLLVEGLALVVSGAWLTTAPELASPALLLLLLLPLPGRVAELEAPDHWTSISCSSRPPSPASKLPMVCSVGDDHTLLLLLLPLLDRCSCLSAAALASAARLEATVSVPAGAAGPLLGAMAASCASRAPFAARTKSINSCSFT